MAFWLFSSWVSNWNFIMEEWLFKEEKRVSMLEVCTSDWVISWLLQLNPTLVTSYNSYIVTYTTYYRKLEEVSF